MSVLTVTQALILGGASVSPLPTNPPAFILSALRGDNGLPGTNGTNGTNGTDANVTNANVNTAIATNATATKGALLLAKPDVGLSNVDNTADSAKSIAPSQLTQAGATTNQAMVWNGTIWAPASISAAPGGSSGQLQYNSAGAFAGVPGVTHASNSTLIVSQAAAAVPLAVQAATSQTGHIFSTRNSVGTACTSVQSDGGMIIDQRAGATYSQMLTVKYIGTEIFAVTLGGATVTGALTLANLTGTISFGGGAQISGTAAAPYPLQAHDGTLGNIKGFLGGGAAVASATALPLPTGRIFHVTGTNNVTSITSPGFKNGAVIMLIFDDVLTFTDGNNLKLSGNFVTSAAATITLGYDGTNWHEACRSVN